MVRIQALGVLVLLGLTAVLSGQDTAAAPARATAAAAWAEGKATISYGVPAWQDAFAEQMQDGFVWRLGSGDPTTCEMTCGLMSESGPVPPGSYKLAVRIGPGCRSSLLVYEGNGFYAEGLKTWSIPCDSMVKDATPKVEKFAMTLDETSRKLHVKFGSFAAVYTCTAIKALPPVETTFARINARIDILAVPVGQGPVKDLVVGTATASNPTGKVSWTIKLTIDGDKPVLAFENTRGAAIPKEKTAVEARIQRIKERMESNPDMKERMTPVLDQQMKQVEALDKEAAAIGRFQATKSVDGTTEAREKPATEIEFSHDRPTGSIVLKFGAGAKTAVFDINPRNFLAPTAAGH